MEYSHKKTKIVATIGPATQSAEVLEQLVRAGLNMARLNMSHGDHAEHRERIKTIRAVSAKLGVPIPILFDLSGPKIRTGTYTTERITIEEGKQIILTTEEIVGDAARISVKYPKLPQEVKSGTIIMLDDGKKRLEVLEIAGTEIVCKVIVGGELKARRGVNVPGAYLSIETITEKDKVDLAFGLAEEVDLVALSFVRLADDVKQLRALMAESGKALPIIVKVETQEAIDNLDAIIAETDGIMVARGDLAIEVPTEMVPIYQKEMIAKCNKLGKPVITATQMLESMIHSPVPTRAEVSDVANAIADGTDAVMLSEETTLGSYPVEAVRMMTRIAETVEKDRSTAPVVVNSVQDSVSAAVAATAKDVGAKLIVALTETGATSRLVARFKPQCPIIALTPHEATVRQLALTRGVYPYKIQSATTLEQAISSIKEFIQNHNLAQPGDSVVITAGLAFGVSGSTNMLFVLRV